MFFNSRTLGFLMGCDEEDKKDEEIWDGDILSPYKFDDFDDDPYDDLRSLLSRNIQTGTSSTQSSSGSATSGISLCPVIANDSSDKEGKQAREDGGLRLEAESTPGGARGRSAHSSPAGSYNKYHQGPGVMRSSSGNLSLSPSVASSARSPEKSFQSPGRNVEQPLDTDSLQSEVSEQSPKSEADPSLETAAARIHEYENVPTSNYIDATRGEVSAASATVVPDKPPIIDSIPGDYDDTLANIVNNLGIDIFEASKSQKCEDISPVVERVPSSQQCTVTTNSQEYNNSANEEPVTYISDDDGEVPADPSKLLDFRSICENMIVVYDGDFLTLRPNTYVTDPIVNFYLDYIHRKLPPALQKDVYIFPTMFYQLLSTVGRTVMRPPINVFDKGCKYDKKRHLKLQ